MLNGGQIGVKSSTLEWFFSGSRLPPRQRARAPSLDDGVTEIPVIRPRPHREHELLHDLLQPESVCRVIKGKFHRAHLLNSIPPTSQLQASDMPFHKPLTLQALWKLSRGRRIRITQWLRAETGIAAPFWAGLDLGIPGKLGEYSSGPERLRLLLSQRPRVRQYPRTRRLGCKLYLPPLGNAGYNHGHLGLS